MGKHFAGYRLKFEKEITFKQLMRIIHDTGLRKEFDTTFETRFIKPDGGVIFLFKDDDPDYSRLVLVAETKRQGTNKDRIKQGKKPQAQGEGQERGVAVDCDSNI